MHPIQVRRNFAVSGISPNPGTFLQRCADLMLRYGNPAVSLSVTNDIQQQNALAYGLPGWRRLLLGGGLRVVAAKRPDRFEAVMAHEASHFNHGDVSFAYLSRAILHSLVYAFGIVLLAYIFWIYRRGLWIQNESLTLVMGTLVFQVGVVTFLLLLGNLEYRALLRSREHYADVEASRYVSSAVLLDTISAVHPTDGVPSRNFSTIFKTHPTPSNRNRVLESPHVLLRRNPFQAFLTGFVGSQILLFANMIAREFPGSAVPSGVTLETISAATFAALIVVLLFSVIASENLRVAHLTRSGFPHLNSCLHHQLCRIR
jgi:hypothetical protein